MNQSAKWIIGLIIVVTIAALGYFISKGPHQPVSIEPIKIGALMILSGDGAAWGENAKKAANLAVEEINQQGGIDGKKLVLIYEDTGGEAKRAVSAYQKLVSIDKVFAIIGPLFQTEVSAIAPLIEKDRMPVLTPSYAPIQNRLNPRNPLLIWMNPTIEAERMAAYVFGSGIKSVGVIGTRDSWENEVSDKFAEKFKALGGKITSQEIVQPDTTDMKLSVIKTIAQKPEAIYLGTYFQFVNSIKAIKDFGYKGKLYGIEVDSYLAGETKPASNNLKFIAPDFYTTDFMEKFEKKYGQKPGIPAGQSYDTMKILINLLEKNKSQDDILKSMMDFKKYDGVSGNIRITNDHKTLFPTAIFEIQDGTITRVEEVK